ncbi:MAG: hypothetical protein MI975_16300 [Cytophagales bacterium]|nr:hypothetical protein [Cytophagales bacterium]
MLWLDKPVVHVNVQKKKPYYISAWGWQPAIATWNWDRESGDIKLKASAQRLKKGEIKIKTIANS